ncbi:hypothetical protein Tcan_02206 [Toxocara canis]|uniref:Uncharacterized protein n=1 Tax=Toxocara canis TaxID=6265 RepID=A0A0B2UQJ1_TOXCA|nr:hypothetical protein Tcan_02206 [Toxocara canis]
MKKTGVICRSQNLLSLKTNELVLVVCAAAVITLGVIVIVIICCIYRSVGRKARRMEAMRQLWEHAEPPVRLFSFFL